jgi:hypothetical protein
MKSNTIRFVCTGVLFALVSGSASTQEKTAEYSLVGTWQGKGRTIKDDRASVYREFTPTFSPDGKMKSIVRTVQVEPGYLELSKVEVTGTYRYTSLGGKKGELIEIVPSFPRPSENSYSIDWVGADELVLTAKVYDYKEKKYKDDKITYRRVVAKAEPKKEKAIDKEAAIKQLQADLAGSVWTYRWRERDYKIAFGKDGEMQLLASWKGVRWRVSGPGEVTLEAAGGARMVLRFEDGWHTFHTNDWDGQPAIGTKK